MTLAHYIFKPFLKPKPIENPSRFHVPAPFEKEPFWGVTISVGATNSANTVLRFDIPYELMIEKKNQNCRLLVCKIVEPLCGNRGIPAPISMKSNKAVVDFCTDGSVTKSGWRMSKKAWNPIFGGKLHRNIVYMLFFSCLL